MKESVVGVKLERNKVGIFTRNKAIGGILYRRVSVSRRGRKFVIWQPWPIEALQDTCTHYGLDIDDELCKALTAEIIAEMGEFTLPESFWTQEEIDHATERAKELVASIEWE